MDWLAGKPGVWLGSIAFVVLAVSGMAIELADETYQKLALLVGGCAALFLALQNAIQALGIRLLERDKERWHRMAAVGLPPSLKGLNHLASTRGAAELAALQQAIVKVCSDVFQPSAHDENLTRATLYLVEESCLAGGQLGQGQLELRHIRSANGSGRHDNARACFHWEPEGRKDRFANFLKGDKAEIVNNIKDLPKTHPLAREKRPYESYMSHPVRTMDETYGFLTVDHPKPNVFCEADGDFLKILATALGTGLAFADGLTVTSATNGSKWEDNNARGGNATDTKSAGQSPQPQESGSARRD
ncbi:hypothetical protein GCM10010124_02190 [Pilimelia terevasa]|uniref:GAF domain-containing protein n=2 Tax=Pilimelia terevasa TaxID=53372 RepID=A0A8J3FE90_9ACTN|nr:hypothetical protein GCM10010124_02190 [Pilimelia terevasa]